MEKYIASGTYYMLQAIYKSKEERNMILDPLTCIIRLAILKYKPEGTKISIHNNRVYFQTPGVSQGVSRWVFGDKRSDLSNLHNPILKATEWFTDHDKQELRGLFELACEGLLKLQDTYGKHTLTSHALNDYIEIINKWLNRKPQTEKSREFNLSNLMTENNSISLSRKPRSRENSHNYDSNSNDLDQEEENLSKQEIDDIQTQHDEDKKPINIDTKMMEKEVNSTIHQQLINLWKEREVQTIKNLFDDLESHNYLEKKHILEAIEIILEMKEKYVNTLIKEVSTIL